MPNITTTQPARPVFRWLTGLSCPVFFLMAIFSAFPSLLGTHEPPQLFSALLFAWAGATCFSIAKTGFLIGGPDKQMLVMKNAQKYAGGEITLDEYGMRTKQILLTDTARPGRS